MLELKIKHLAGTSKKTGEHYEMDLLYVVVNVLGKETEIVLNTKTMLEKNIIVNAIAKYNK